MEPNGAIETTLPQQSDDALAFAKRIAADDMGAFGKECDIVKEFGDFVLRRRVAEHWEGKGRFGDEKVARNEFERLAGRVWAAFIIATDDGALSFIFHDDLRTAKNMPGGSKPKRDVAKAKALVIGDFMLVRSGTVFSHTGAHNGEGLWRSEYVLMIWASVIGMGVADHATGNRMKRVDIEISRRAEQPFRPGGQPMQKSLSSNLMRGMAYAFPYDEFASR